MFNHPAFIGAVIALSILAAGGIVATGHTFIQASISASDASDWLGFWGGIAGGLFTGFAAIVALAVAVAEMHHARRLATRVEDEALRIFKEEIVPILEDVDAIWDVAEQVAKASTPETICECLDRLFYGASRTSVFDTGKLSFVFEATNSLSLTDRRKALRLRAAIDAIPTAFDWLRKAADNGKSRQVGAQLSVACDRVSNAAQVIDPGFSNIFKDRDSMFRVKFPSSFRHGFTVPGIYSQTSDDEEVQG